MPSHIFLGSFQLCWKTPSSPKKAKHVINSNKLFRMSQSLDPRLAWLKSQVESGLLLEFQEAKQPPKWVKDPTSAPFQSSVDETDIQVLSPPEDPVLVNALKDPFSHCLVRNGEANLQLLLNFLNAGRPSTKPTASSSINSSALVFWAEQVKEETFVTPKLLNPPATDPLLTKEENATPAVTGSSNALNVGASTTLAPTTNETQPNSDSMGESVGAEIHQEETATRPELSSINMETQTLVSKAYFSYLSTTHSGILDASHQKHPLQLMLSNPLSPLNLLEHILSFRCLADKYQKIWPMWTLCTFWETSRSRFQCPLTSVVIMLLFLLS